MDCRTARSNNPDEWMESCPEASRPVCELLREWILSWEPELRESIKWNMLCYSGKKLVCAIGGFKRHAGLTFFRGRELPAALEICDQGAQSVSIMSMKIPSVECLDRGATRRLLRAAVQLDESVPPIRLSKQPRPLPPVPAALAKALRKNQTASAHWKALSPSCQREYIVWVGTAKRPETLAKRLGETVAALERGRKWAQRRA